MNKEAARTLETLYKLYDVREMIDIESPFDDDSLTAREVINNLILANVEKLVREYCTEKKNRTNEKSVYDVKKIFDETV